MSDLPLAKPLPEDAAYLAELAVTTAEKYQLSPYMLLGLAFAESKYGAALTPPGPEGTGDFIPRPDNASRRDRMAATPLPGVVLVDSPNGIPARGIPGPAKVWKPTDTGWDVGLLQVDYETHFDFCKSGDWKVPALIFDYVGRLFRISRQQIKDACPDMDAVTLDRAMIASHNAGAARVIQAYKAGQSFDTVTFRTGYVDKICDKADELAGKSSAWATPPGEYTLSPEEQRSVSSANSNRSTLFNAGARHQALMNGGSAANRASQARARAALKIPAGVKGSPILMDFDTGELTGELAEAPEQQNGAGVAPEIEVITDDEG